MIKLPEFNKEYFENLLKQKQNNEKFFHQNYARSTDVFQHLDFHLNGIYSKYNTVGITSNATNQGRLNPYFKRIISARRPSESGEIENYRRQQYLQYTRSVAEKVINSLRKIVKCPDFKIEYSDLESLPSAASGENSLLCYCDENYPKYDSIENYAYNVLIEKMLHDPNALCVTAPLDVFFKYTKFEIDPEQQEEENTQLIKPFSQVIPCENVYDYLEDNFYTFLSTYKSVYHDSQGNIKYGKIVITVTDKKYIIAAESGKDMIDIEEIEHNIGIAPAFLLGGIHRGDNIFASYYESFLSPMLPFLDAIARDSSDMDAEKVQHLFSTMFYYQTQSCKTCDGNGYVLNRGEQTVRTTCSDCGGNGKMPFNPFTHFEVNANNTILNDKQIPNPPAGYIEKSTEILKTMREEIRYSTYGALASMNMEFLFKEPISGESGIKAAIDRDEANAVIYSIAYHLIENIIKPIFYFTNELRYSKIVSDKEAREAMLPKIAIPKDFQFIIHDSIVDDLVKISASNISSQVKLILENEFLRAEFSDRPDMYNKNILRQEMSPFPTASTADIEIMMNSGLCSKIDAFACLCIDEFVALKCNEDKNENDASKKFFNLKLEEQKKQLYEFAQKKLDAYNSENESSVNKMSGFEDNKFDEQGNMVDEQGVVIMSAEDVKKRGIKTPVNANNN